MHKQILYVVKFKDKFNREMYLPYFFEDITRFMRDLKKIGDTDIKFVAFINHNEVTDKAENVINEETKKSDINEERIHKALKIIYNKQEEVKEYDKY